MGNGVVCNNGHVALFKLIYFCCAFGVSTMVAFRKENSKSREILKKKNAFKYSNKEKWFFF